MIHLTTATGNKQIFAATAMLFLCLISVKKSAHFQKIYSLQNVETINGIALMLVPVESSRDRHIRVQDTELQNTKMGQSSSEYVFLYI